MIAKHDNGLVTLVCFSFRAMTMMLVQTWYLLCRVDIGVVICVYTEHEKKVLLAAPSLGELGRQCVIATPSIIWAHQLNVPGYL